MKYLLFAGDYYYPVGGWNDFKGKFDDLEVAKQAAEEKNHDWAHIVNLDDTIMLKMEKSWESKRGEFFIWKRVGHKL